MGRLKIKTYNKKLYLTYYVGIVLGFLYVLHVLSSLVIELPQEEIERIQEEQEALIATSFESLLSGNISSDADTNFQSLVKLVPQEKLQQMYTTLSPAEIAQVEKFLLIADPQSAPHLFELFADLSISEIKRLIALSEKLGVKRTEILVALMLQIGEHGRRDLIEVLFNLPLNDIVGLMHMLDGYATQDLLELLELFASIPNPSDAVNLFLRMDESYHSLLIDLLLEHDIKFVESMSEFMLRFDADLFEKYIDVFSRLSKRHQIMIIDFLKQSSDDDIRVAIETFHKMNNSHIERALDLIEEDKTLLDRGIYLSARFDKHLSEKGKIETLERSINTAARVDVETRSRGLDIITDNVRDVQARRVFKQVDGHRDVYTDETVIELVKDYDLYDNQRTFVDVVSSSDGLIHGPHRPADSYVTQERKLEVIKLYYSGELKDKKDDTLKFYERKILLVPFQTEQTFDIQDPQELKSDPQF